MHIVVLGGGFGGVATARHLERALRGHPDADITLVSRENFFVITPLLFEACTGRLELRHCAQPVRAALRRTRFIEATVEGVDVQSQIVRAAAPDGRTRYELPYDHLVVALGASTNEQQIPGSSNAFTFKTMADALVLRNHLIEQFERADAASESTARRGCLTVILIGGGLVGMELLGELTAFADDVLRFYPRLRRDEVRFLLFEAGPRVLPEIDEKLAAVAARVLRGRGADIRVATPVRSIEAGRVLVGSEVIEAATIVLAAGIVPSSVAAAVPVLHDERGRIAVDGDDAESKRPSRLGAGRLRGDPVTRWPHVSGPGAAHRARGEAPRAQHPGGDRRAHPDAIRLHAARDDGVARAHACGGARGSTAPHRVPGLVDSADVLPVPDASMGSAPAHRPRLDGGAVLQARHHQGRLASRAGAGAPGARHGSHREPGPDMSRANSEEALRRRAGAGRLTWRGPALMLFARSVCAVAAQALVAAIFLLRASPDPMA